MSGTLVVSAAPGEIRAALLEAGDPVELWLEREDRASLLGAVFAGRVQQIVPALPGGFIDLGLDRPGFLPGSGLPPEGSRILVQVAKDRFADKPVELTKLLSVAGRLALWQPGREGVRFSRRIPAAGRPALAAIAAGLLGSGEGLLFRSRAADADPDVLAAEIRGLRGLCDAMRRAAESGLPRRLDPVPHPAISLVASIDEPIGRIVTDDRAVFAALRRDPVLASLVAFDGDSGFEARHGLDEAFAGILEPVVPLDGGGRLVIESLTAFTAIDVDLGAEAGSRGRAADAIRRINLAAAREIPRQLRLRALGGAIIVDFISMETRAARDEIQAVLAAGSALDPVSVQIHGWTRLGHVELTRRRARTPLADLMLDPPGHRARTAETVALALLRHLVKAPFGPGALRVRLHPGIVAVLHGPLARHLASASSSAGRKVVLVADPLADSETFDIGADSA